MVFLHQGNFTARLSPDTRKKTLELRDRILQDDNLHCLWQDVLISSLLLFFSPGGQEPAVQLLEAYFEFCPVERNGNGDLLWTNYDPYPIHEQKALLMMLHHAPRRPTNLPWIDLTDEQLQDPAFDMTKAEFFYSGVIPWTNVDWIEKGTDYARQENFELIDEGYDSHQWRTSNDPWTHAICARLLCKVPFGQVASREAVEEAYEAVDKLFTQLPKRHSATEEDEWPHCHLFPVKVYFLLAVNLGYREKAREILRLAMMKEEFALNDLVEIPAAYEILLAEDKEAEIGTSLVLREEVKTMQKELLNACKERKENGQQEPLPGVQWPELLRRFSEAAFKTQSEEFEGIQTNDGEEIAPIEQPSDLLLPPISAERLAEVEEQLGPLPQDLREMVLIANGFLGGWHFAGGGFAGVDKLYLEHPSEYEIYLGIEPPAEVTTETITNPDGTTRTVTKHTISIGLDHTSGVEWGPVYASWGTVENDGFHHLICPPETWKKMRKGEVREGEYRVCHYAAWTGGADGREWRSMRHWVADMTAEMERELEGMEDE